MSSARAKVMDFSSPIDTSNIVVVIKVFNIKIRKILLKMEVSKE